MKINKFVLLVCCIANLPLRLYCQDFDSTFYSIEDAIKEPTKVKTLNLPSKSYKKIPQEVFLFPHLEVLYLDNNDIRSIPNDIIKLTKLNTLILSHNNLRYVSSKLKELKHFKYLDLSDNNLSKVPFEISSLKYLETIILDNNSITDCSFKSRNIKKIIANFNKITSINGSFFSQYPNLQVLSLISNRIKKLPDNIRSAKNLKHLNLSNNQLQFIPEMLLELDNLEILRLGKNRITEIPTKLYDSKIKLVILSENPIPVSKIKNRLFSENGKQIIIQEILEGYEYLPE